jgi:hypothetical protein
MFSRARFMQDLRFLESMSVFHSLSIEPKAKVIVPTL